MTKKKEIEVEKKPRPNLVFSAYQGQDLTPIWNTSGYLPDKMQVSDEFTEQLKLCRFYAKKDPLVAGVIDKQIELAFNEILPKKGECTDEEFLVYKSTSKLILRSLKVIAYEYLVSGLVIPNVIWEKIKGKDLGIKGKPNKEYSIPDSIWVRNPDTIVLKRTPIPSQVRAFYRIPSEDIYFITNKGTYLDGTKDKELYDQLVEDYPEFVKDVKEGQALVALKDELVIRRRPTSDNIYPTPYLLPALESLHHKRNLKKMDYAIAARVIGAIQVITLGDKDFPLTEDDKDQIDDLKAQMAWRGNPMNTERVFQLFGNHTLKISWVTPPVEALLDDAKYTTVNADIFKALGFPNILVSGETGRSGTSQAEFALLPPTEMLKGLRNELLPIIERIYDEIKERNKFSNVPTPKFAPVKLYDPQKAATMGQTLYNAGIISGTSFGEMADFDYSDEQLQRKTDQEMITELGINPAPQVPFSSPSINQGNNTIMNDQNHTVPQNTKTDPKTVQERPF